MSDYKRLTEKWRAWRSGAIDYVLSLGNIETFEFRVSSITNKSTVIASATACLLLNFLDALDEFPTSQKKK